MRKNFIILSALGAILSGCGTYQMMPFSLNCGNAGPNALVKAQVAPLASAQKIEALETKVCPPEPLCYYEIYTSDASLEASSASAIVVQGVSFQPFVFHIKTENAALAAPAAIVPESKCYDPSSKEWVYGADPASALAKLGCHI